MAALVDAEPTSDWGKPNERTMFELPADRRRLMALLRGGGELPGEPTVGQHMLASSCVLGGAPPSPIPSPETYHVCRPGTGLFNVGYSDSSSWLELDVAPFSPAFLGATPPHTCLMISMCSS